ncbi:MAG: hypothetical protein GQ564_20425 [Bacteroidales bacterium]|nr:hypothetical protein [Bacteroidales bacterium]
MKHFRIILLAWLVVFSGCNRHDDCRYFEEECHAIIDLVPLMVDLDYMIAHNNYNLEKPSLFIINELYGKIYKIKNEELTRKDQKILDPLIRGKMSDRLITQKIVSDFSKIKLVVLDKMEFETHIQNKNNIVNDVFGYLVVSRIAFDRKYQVGFVEYSFFCGEACAWKSLIKIIKINNKWIKDKEIFEWRA